MSSSQFLKAFVVQIPNSFDVRANSEMMLSMLKDVPASALVVFPEGALSGYAEDSEFVNNIDTRALGEAIELMKNYASSRRIHLTFGTCIKDRNSWYNATLYFGPEGSQHVYRKVNLAISERGLFKSGDELTSFEIMHFDRPVKVAFQLCREIRFPEQWGSLARQGAELFIYATNAAGDNKQADVWRSHLVSRAAENQRFVLCANVAAKEQKCPSMIVTPEGYVPWEVLSDKALIGEYDLDLSLVSNWYLNQSRQDIVGYTR